jgi:fumarate reductase subunit D
MRYLELNADFSMIQTVDYKTAHQNIGHVVILFLLILALWRILQHTRLHSERSWVVQTGIWLGVLTWILALVDGFL